MGLCNEMRFPRHTGQRATSFAEKRDWVRKPHVVGKVLCQPMC